MHSWKKKLVVSQLALACTLAITSQANATTYNTFGYHDDADTAFSWSDWENKDKLNYINYYWICPYISRHLLSLNPLQARCRRYSRGER